MKHEALKRCHECGRIYDGNECPECGLYAQEYANPEDYDDDADEFIDEEVNTHRLVEEEDED